MSINIEDLKAALKEIPANELSAILGKEFLTNLVSQLSETEKIQLFGRSHLSDRAIMRNMELGNIVIDPFNPRNLGSSSYDGRLGQYYFEEQDLAGGPAVFNIYSPKDVKRVWGEVKTALPLRIWLKEKYPFEGLENISLDDWIIPIRPGGTVLGHTIEFIGGRNGIITSHMKARSTFGRCFMEVCKCSGEGSVGFFNRWTMEFTNNSKDKWIPLVVGRRTSQIIFMQVEPILDKDYTFEGKYQLSQQIEEVKKNWKPEDMLPALWKDWEVTEKILGTTFLSH